MSLRHDPTDALASYREYNKILRIWFVGFGVGGPALLLTNKALAQQLAVRGELRWVAGLFLGAVVFQVIGALINKVANYYVYESQKLGSDPSKWIYRQANYLVEQFWIDFVLDLLSIALFGLAIWDLLTAFAGE